MSTFKEDWASLCTFLNKWYYKPDIEGLRIILCTYLSHFYFSSPPVWLSVIGLPGSGKTEIGIKPLQQLSNVYPVSELTVNSFLSGYGDNNGILDKLTQISKGSTETHGVLVFPDFTTTLLSKDQFTRADVMGQMRRVYDGAFEKKVGNKQKMLTWSGKVTCIAAATPDIEDHWAVYRDMGERWLGIRWLGPGDTFEERMKKAEYASKQEGHEEEIRKGLHKYILRLLEDVSEGPSEYFKSSELMATAILLEECRVNVKREFTGRGYEVTGLGNKQDSTRTPKSLFIVAKASATLRRSNKIEDIDIHLAKRIAMDSIPTKRLKILESLIAIYPETLSKTELIRTTSIAKSTFDRVIEDMRHLKLIDVAQDSKNAGDPIETLIEDNISSANVEKVWEENPYHFSKVKHNWAIRLNINVIKVLKEAKLLPQKRAITHSN